MSFHAVEHYTQGDRFRPLSSLNVTITHMYWHCLIITGSLVTSLSLMGMWHGIFCNAMHGVNDTSLFCSVFDPHSKSFVVTQLVAYLDLIFLGVKHWGVELTPTKINSINLVVQGLPTLHILIS